MITEETVRIAAATNALRPDWSNADLVTFITRNLGHHSYRDVAVVLVWVATDPKTQTPRRALEPGPWWDAVSGERTGTPTPPRVSEVRCRNCGRSTAGNPDHNCAAPATPDRIRQIRAEAGI